MADVAVCLHRSQSNSSAREEEEIINNGLFKNAVHCSQIGEFVIRECLPLTSAGQSESNSDDFCVSKLKFL